MQTKIALLAFCFYYSLGAVYSQGTWVQKANFGGTARFGSLSFSIGNKGYIGCGSLSSISQLEQDFWEWDQLTDTWSQKANFGGGKRGWAVSFSIGSKGYAGTGESPAFPYVNQCRLVKL